MHIISKRNAGSDGLMATKLDMCKAYDRIEWSFLRRIMLEMGFPVQWVDLVMRCVTSVSYFVLLNGKEYGLILPTRGLRQGDPLSPYLFLLCSEGLSSLLKHANMVGHIRGIQVAPTRPILKHMCFADDTILFTRANVKTRPRFFIGTLDKF